MDVDKHISIEVLKEQVRDLVAEVKRLQERVRELELK